MIWSPGWTEISWSSVVLQHRPQGLCIPEHRTGWETSWWMQLLTGSGEATLSSALCDSNGTWGNKWILSSWLFSFFTFYLVTFTVRSYASKWQHRNNKGKMHWHAVLIDIIIRRCQKDDTHSYQLGDAGFTKFRKKGPMFSDHLCNRQTGISSISVNKSEEYYHVFSMDLSSICLCHLIITIGTFSDAVSWCFCSGLFFLFFSFSMS